MTELWGSPPPPGVKVVPNVGVLPLLRGPRFKTMQPGWTDGARTADVTMRLVSRLLGHEFHFSPMSCGKSFFIAIHNITYDEPALDCVTRPSASLLTL